MKKSDIFWQTYLNLEKEVIEVSRYIFFTDEKLVNNKNGIVAEECKSQLETFSPHIADLLVRCCVQIEALSKEIYFDNGGSKKRGDSSILFDKDCLKLIDIKWGTHDKIVMVVAPFFNFTKDENKILKPLKDAHKGQGAYWERAYQAVKHDRYYSLYKGNIKALIHSLAALYLLNLYYRKESWVIKYQEISSFSQYNMGSAIFAVKPPVLNQPWYGNDPILSDSPYVVNYIEDDYRKIEELQIQEQNAIDEYWHNQPELQDPLFIEQLKKASENRMRVMGIWELAKYRLNKKIPAGLPFMERKDLLIKSEEWNCAMHKHNSHLVESELTEDNIQEEIDSAGRYWGIEIMKKYQKLEWVPFATGDALCRIYIPN